MPCQYLYLDAQLAGSVLRTLANIAYLVNVLKKFSRNVLRMLSHFKYFSVRLNVN